MTCTFKSVSYFVVKEDNFTATPTLNLVLTSYLIVNARRKGKEFN